MILPILLALLLLLESSQSLRRTTMHLLRCSNQEQKISAINIGKFGYQFNIEQLLGWNC